jgi:hypothetical protein
MPGLRDIPFAGILKRARLTPLELTRAEASRVEETPGIERATFSKVFGGHQKSEWPQCSKFPGYSDFFLADIVVQPFAPDAAGKPGLLLRLPSVIETPGFEKYEIHVLSNTLQGDGLHYRGKYTRVPVPAVRRIHFDWSGLPHKVCDSDTLLLIGQGFVTYYSFRNGGSNVLVLHGDPPAVPSVHASNFGTNMGASPPLPRSRPIFSVSMIK